MCDGGHFDRNHPSAYRQPFDMSRRRRTVNFRAGERAAVRSHHARVARGLHTSMATLLFARRRRPYHPSVGFNLFAVSLLTALSTLGNHNYADAAPTSRFWGFGERKLHERPANSNTICALKLPSVNKLRSIFCHVITAQNVIVGQPCRPIYCKNKLPIWLSINILN